MKRARARSQGPRQSSSGAIGEAFGRCHEEGRKAFIPYLTAGDPDIETTGQLMRALVDGGADLIELGVPFSDPIADGPTNQRASTRALSSGTTLSAILALVSKERSRVEVPIVLFTYFNPIHVRGVDVFARQAADAGVDGVLCVDLPPEEGEGEFIPTMQENGVDCVFLLSPTSTRARIKKVSESSSGFVYYVSRTGVTGERDALPAELVGEVKQLRKRLHLPVAVGFGISTPQQVRAVAEIADGVVVGSALVRVVEENQGRDNLVSLVESRVRELSAPLREEKKK